MPAQFPGSIDKSDTLPLLRRFSGGVSKLGIVRATLLLALVSALGSFCLTWVFLWASGSHRMGNAIWISLLVPVPLTIAFGGACMLLVISLDKAWKRVNEMAMLDTLTGLSNRRDFMPAAQRELDLALRHRQPLALLVLDVDHFKAINDTLGHLGGDEVLVQVAHRCRQALRTTDLLARWGGEEFIMLLPNTPLAQARQLAERVRASIIEAPAIVVSDRPVAVTASLGAAGIMPGQVSSLEQLIRRADSALYLAKSAGRDQVSIAESDRPGVDHMPARATMAWAGEMPAALTADSPAAPRIIQ